MSRLKPNCSDRSWHAAHFARSGRMLAAACLLLSLSSLHRASAADWLGDAGLRGSLAPVGYTRWDGWQFGALVSYGNLNADFGSSASSQIAFILRNTTLEAEGAPSTWTTLPAGSTNGPIFGGFVGYNMQWDQLVLGWDLEYRHPSILQTSAADSMSRRFDTSDNIQHDVTIAAQASFKLVDYAVLRARAGYAVGQFLPYAA